MNERIPPEVILLLTKSMTQDGKVPLRELEAERFLNAITRANTDTPTGSLSSEGPSSSSVTR